MKKYSILLILAIQLLCAQNSLAWEENFKKAADFYLNKNYDSAIAYYQSLELDYVSSGLYYNLGNAYYQKQELGLSTLYFEKAHALDPNNEDIAHNLALVQAQQSDEFEQKDFPLFLADQLSQLFAFSDWLRSAWVFAFVFWLAFASFLFLKMGRIFSLPVFILALLLSFSCMGFAYRSHQLLVQAQYLVVLQNNTSIYVEPAGNADVLHNLHEGAKLKILSENAEYYQIQTLSNSKGWVKKERVGKV